MILQMTPRLCRSYAGAVALALSVAPALADPCEAPLPKRGETFTGVVTYVGDGDMMCVGRDHGGIEIRLADWYAVEIDEPGGPEAKYLLKNLVLGRYVTCVSGRKNWDRVIAQCTMDGRPMRDWIIEQGGVEGGKR